MSGSPVLRRQRTWLRHGLGWPGLLGLALLLLAAALVWRGWPATARARPPAAAAAPRPALTDPAAARVAALLGQLPPATQHTADLARLVGWADAQGLRLEQADSSAADPGGLPLQRIDLQLRMAADYESTRRWLVAVLNELPHAGLRSLRFEREDATQPLATQLTLRLHYRAGPAPEGAR
ncbi:hypothetical protein [Pseudaquabacterium pictum]|uniref:Uncharacterized protein n=1 Tax=Pseudaquabacterium pictum TaxID=2315236 RepID=A0A480AY40_9BURK|nr:hypothetical protein [Rubrivivax pictus]GCL66273.1 hypothetical protein AQPW35_53540 [Rubrivivax pictus]